MKLLYAFLGGAIAGAGLALLFAPEKGEDLREQIKEVLRKYGVIPASSEEEIVDEIVAEITASKK